MNDFGSYIKNVRESKNMTLNQVALYAEISAAQLSRIETGKRGTPKPQTIEKIAHALKVNYNELMKIAGYIEDNEPLIPLAKQGESDLLKDLEKVNTGVNNGSYIHIGNQTIDDLDQDDRELLLSSIKNTMKLAERLAKSKNAKK